MVRPVVSGIAAVVIMLGSAAAQAQAPQSEANTSRPSPAYRGLFGSDGRSRQELNVTFALYEEYQKGSLDNASQSGPFQVPQGGSFTALRTDVSYNHRGAHSTFGLRTEGNVRHYPALQSYSDPRFRSDLGLSTAVGRRQQTSVSLSAGIERSPYYRVSLFPTASILNETPASVTNRDDALIDRATSNYTGSFGLEHAFSPRSSIGLTGAIRHADVAGASGVNDYRTGMSYSRKMSQYLAVRFGYMYERGQYGAATSQVNDIESHGLDLGLDYRRPISRSRKTTIAFGSGSTVVKVGPDKRYVVTGFTNVRHEMLQGWIAQLEYNRGVQLIAGFANPFFADTITESFGGYITRRVELATSAGYSFGEVGLIGDRYRAIEGSARVRVAATRFAAVEAQYLYYRYAFDRGVTMLDMLARETSRSAVRVDLTLWFSLFR